MVDVDDGPEELDEERPGQVAVEKGGHPPGPGAEQQDAKAEEKQRRGRDVEPSLDKRSESDAAVPAGRSYPRADARDERGYDDEQQRPTSK